jgi:hypothetical protein
LSEATEEPPPNEKHKSSFHYMSGVTMLLDD